MFLFLAAGLALWVYLDAKKRCADNPDAWAVGTLLLAIAVMPFNLAKRPLMQGEVREGGTGWNVLKCFAAIWTATMTMAAFAACASMGAAMKPGISNAEAAGAGLGVVLGLGMIGALWFFPVLGALALGLFVRKTLVVERG